MKTFLFGTVAALGLAFGAMPQQASAHEGHRHWVRRPVIVAPAPCPPRVVVPAPCVPAVVVPHAARVYQRGCYHPVFPRYCR
jgi:hypothetical protein